mgnify:FL=1
MKKRISKFNKKATEQFKNLKNYLLKIIEIIKKPEMGILPGQLAFFIILSLVPIITLCGFGAGLFNINMDTVIDILDNIIPTGVEFLKPYLTGNTIDLKLALIFLWMFYLASNGCNTVILISNQIYGINQSNWIKRRIKAIFMTFGIVVIIIFLLVFPVFGKKILELFEFTNISSTIKEIFKILKGPLTWLVMFIFLRGIYEIAPDRVRRNSHINTGAILTTGGWIILTWFYSQISTNMTTYNIFYGALSNIAILMLWLYFMSFVFVIGLSLNYGEEMEQEKVLNENRPLKVVKERSQAKDTEE